MKYPGWIPKHVSLCKDDSCFTFFYNLATFAEAETECNSMAEQHRLAEPRTETGLKLLMSLAGSGSLARNQWWLGLTDKMNKGTWRFVSDQSEAPSTSIPWGPDQPSGGQDENCLAMMNVKELQKIADENCEENLANPVCEKIITTATTTTTTTTTTAATSTSTSPLATNTQCTVTHEYGQYIHPYLPCPS